MTADEGAYCPRPGHRGTWQHGSPPLDRYTDVSGWTCPGVALNGSPCGYELRSASPPGEIIGYRIGDQVWHPSDVTIIRRESAVTTQERQD